MATVLVTTQSDLISVCIPVAVGRDPSLPVRTLLGQERDIRYDLQFCIVNDYEKRGAPWARNRAAAMAVGGYLLFSDDDIMWYPGALRSLWEALRDNPTASFSYGSWLLKGGPRDGLVQCHEQWDPRVLQRRNFVSTMSLIRRSAFVGFDESLPRLQDWEMFLRMHLGFGYVGVQCGALLFETTGDIDGGISSSGSSAYQQAWEYIQRKHRIPS